MEQAAQEMARKTEAELARAERQPAGSRTWTVSQGYKVLIQWSNLVLLRILIRKFTNTLPLSSYNNPLKEFRGDYRNLKESKSPLHFEDRLKTQLDDAGRSTVSNIEEGYKRDNTEAYIKFISYTQGSLEEIRGLINQCLQDGFIKSVPGSSLTDLGIDLKAWNEWCRNPLNSSRLLYFPLKENKGSYRKLEEIPGTALTYEIFIELINKTDFLLRKLVVSLEQKINKDKLNIWK